MNKSIKTQLLLSYIKPHLPVKPCTMSNWICEVLKYAGVDIKTFKSHLVRWASTSKAKSLVVSTKQILKRGIRSSKSTWQKFYNKEIVSHEETKLQSILAPWTDDEEIPFLQTYAVRLGEFSIRSYFNFIHKILIIMQVHRYISHCYSTTWHSLIFEKVKINMNRAKDRPKKK